MLALAIADDTTGALEVGAKFAMAGLRAVVSTDHSLRLQAQAQVIDAQTRRLDAAAARSRTAELARAARSAGVQHLYWKTDSTLRGNIASCFDAVLEVFPERVLLYVPAYPAMGRTVRGGELFVHGVPLDQTAFAQDPSNPARDGHILSLLASGCGAPVRLVSDMNCLRPVLEQAPARTVVVCDGSTDGDLEAAAQAWMEAGREAVVAGTAGFCGPWAGMLNAVRSAPGEPPAMRRVLVVSGSRHPLSRAQVACAAGSGAAVFLLGDPKDDARLGEEIAGAVRRGGWAILATSGTSPWDVAVRLGELARSVAAAAPLEGLIVFGGDTAAGVLAALEVQTVDSWGELLPGVPLSWIHAPSGPMPLVTKAGGFGEETLLLELRAALKGGA